MSRKTNPAEFLDLFDQWASQPQAAAEPHTAGDASSSGEDAADGLSTHDGDAALPMTPPALRGAVQELLKQGWLEQSAKPRLFQTIAADTGRIDALLEPLDLRVRVDEIRGLAFTTVVPGYAGDEDDADEWSHPLVRRQRLTLEQSLLVAILRREFVQREQENGQGVTVRVSADDLLPQLEIYLGQTGSDMQSRKRLMNLLENLRGHGVVSEPDAQDVLVIRPMIVHLANPENLQALLQALRGLAQSSGGAAAGQPDAGD